MKPTADYILKREFRQGNNFLSSKNIISLDKSNIKTYNKVFSYVIGKTLFSHIESVNKISRRDLNTCSELIKRRIPYIKAAKVSPQGLNVGLSNPRIPMIFTTSQSAKKALNNVDRAMDVDSSMRFGGCSIRMTTIIPSRKKTDRADSK